MNEMNEWPAPARSGHLFGTPAEHLVHVVGNVLDLNSGYGADLRHCGAVLTVPSQVRARISTRGSRTRKCRPLRRNNLILIDRSACAARSSVQALTRCA